jgi:hypothetical protein
MIGQRGCCDSVTSIEFDHETFSTAYEPGDRTPQPHQPDSAPSSVAYLIDTIVGWLGGPLLHGLATREAGEQPEMTAVHFAVTVTT